MPSVIPQKAQPLDKILVIDELPMIPLAFQEVFQKINPPVHIEYSENVYNALSAKTWDNTVCDLVIIGSLHEGYSTDLHKTVAELRQRFGQPMVMIYSTIYDPVIIEKMKETGIDAYVHKFEPIHEIRRAYEQLSRGEAFISSIFLTLLSYPPFPKE